MNTRLRLWLQSVLQGMVSAALLFSVAPAPHAFAKPYQGDLDPIGQGDDQHLLGEARERLKDVTDSLPEKQKNLAKLQTQLQKASTDTERDALAKQIEDASVGIRDLVAGFEDIASGGVDIKTLSPESESFDWQAETLEIVKPIIDEMKQLTEKPRTIERLKRETHRLETRLAAIRGGIQRMSQLERGMEPGETLSRLTKLRERWLELEADSVRELEITQLRLAEITGPQQSLGGRIVGVLGGFLTGRGANVLIALLVFCLVFALMRLTLSIFLKRRKLVAGTPRGVFDRLFQFGYRIFTVIMATLALLMSLYVVQDWLSLSVTVLVLVGIGIALKSSIPRFFLETKLLLNVGAVREGERVIYKQLPWLVPSINLFTHVVNPQLEGGTVRLALEDLVPLRSRPQVADEPWFPSRKGDWMLMPDDFLGQVIRQTPEIVQLAGYGQTQRSYVCQDFLSSNAMNLSSGTFGVSVTFGVDYDHQDQCTETIPRLMHEGLVKRLQLWEWSSQVKNVKVQFKEAAASSLDLLVMLTVSSEAARHYYHLQRLVQQACVEICTEHHWCIPFNQVTVHGLNARTERTDS